MSRILTDHRSLFGVNSLPEPRLGRGSNDDKGRGSDWSLSGGCTPRPREAGTGSRGSRGCTGGGRDGGGGSSGQEGSRGPTGEGAGQTQRGQTCQREEAPGEQEQMTIPRCLRLFSSICRHPTLAFEMLLRPFELEVCYYYYYYEAHI